MAQARARSDEAKRARRQFILATAEQLLRRYGFDTFTTNKLAKAANLAKGTLYLYFATREELVLQIYVDLQDDWISQFIAAEKQMIPKDYDDLCTRFYQSFVADALLVDLAARVTSGIEPYVPIAAWVKAKEAQTLSGKRLGGMFCQNFDCDPVQAQRLAWAFLAALSGAQQRAFNWADGAAMPKSFQKIGKVMSPENVFLNMVLPLAPCVPK